MNYLLDKKHKKNKKRNIIIGIFAVILVIYFSSSIFYGLSYTAHFITKPFLNFGNFVGNKFTNTSAYFSSKKSLYKENENLKMKLEEMNARVSNYNSVADENIKLKEILNRKQTGAEMIVSGILSKPNQSAYDTLIIDAGDKDGITVGQRVFAFGNIPIGKITEVYAGSAKVVLFSSPGEKTDIVISGKDVFMQAIGKGAGNFEMILPRDFVLEVGTEVDLPGINPKILGYVASIVSDPRDSFQKALLRSPVNIFELKLVEVER